MHQDLIDRLGYSIQRFSVEQNVPVKVEHDTKHMVGHRTSQVLAFRLLMHNEGQVKALIAKADAFALRIKASTGINTTVGIRQSKGEIIFETSLPPSMFAPLPLTRLRPGKGPLVAVGQSVLEEQVNISLNNDNTPHALIAGTSGSGKSELLRTILFQIARQNKPDRVSLLLIDPNDRAMVPFKGVAHLAHPVITDPIEAIKALVWADQEMTRRTSLPEEAVATMERIVIVIDELAGIVAATGGENGMAARMIGRIASQGRKYGLHIIAATQHPTQENIGGNMVRANMPTRFALRVMDDQASKLAGGYASLGAHKLMGRGDCILVAAGTVQRFQVAMVNPDDLFALPRGNGRYLPLDTISVEGVTSNAGAAQPPAERMDPLTPEEIAWVLANITSDLPGIGRIKRQFKIGSAKATRLQDHCREINKALDALNCAVYSYEEIQDVDGDDEQSEDDDDG